MTRRYKSLGFTLIEMLTVITIIMVVMALALPNFVAMMRDRRWSAAIANIQGMVLRARAFATNVRKEFSVEFNIQPDNGTTMWLESEDNYMEHIPDLNKYQYDHGGISGLGDFVDNVFKKSGGRAERLTSSPWGLQYCFCYACGRIFYVPPDSTSPEICPSCGGVHTIYRFELYVNISYDGSKSDPAYYGDNAKESEDVPLSRSITIDLTRSRYFISWDAPSATYPYGRDPYPDIRIGTNGALVETNDPVICLKERHAEERRAVSVVRCTGRLIPASVP